MTDEASMDPIRRPRVLFVYYTYTQQSLRVVEAMADALRERGCEVLLKNAPPEELVHAVRIVAAGDALLAPSVTRRVIAEYAQRPAPPKQDPGLGRLTEREAEVLRLLATGKSNAELATHLYLGEGTIKTHVSHLLAKLGLRDRVQAVVFAYESGLVEPGEP